MANERRPANPLPSDFVPEGYASIHRVSDGENWASVAAQHDVDVGDLIFFNFQTRNTDEINWYLRRNVGCDTSNDGGVNWAFSSSADPGLIYIPPPEVIDMDEEFITGSRPVLIRCQEVAENIPGNPGKRLRRMLSIVVDRDRPAWLWFYNPAAVNYYIDKNRSNADRRTMTQDTNEAVPFDGDTGPGFFGAWRRYPFSEIIVRDTNDHHSNERLRIYLEGIENEIFHSWESMAAVENLLQLGGGSAVPPLIVAFLEHIHDLADMPDHIYYLYQHEDEL
jgi:hypothetical protein